MDTPPRPERRVARFTVPDCPHCVEQEREGHVDVVSRTPYVLYLRCRTCAAVWSVPKPGART
jgi:hypothetical protein